MGGLLDARWTFGEQIGGGGFARVLEAWDEHGTRHAAKFVQMRPGASRELLLADLGDARNVVPVLDYGQIGDEYVLIMPLAESSLQEQVERHGPLPQSDALDILIDVATALADLDEAVVHRDLKPANVLLLGGTWQLADFGISRYADAATKAGETRKQFMSPHYAAPEQWRYERASSATDIYALGVMAYELLEGRRPFAGTNEDLREAHLHADPPAPSVGPVLAALVQECMLKAPEARPSAANLLARLTRARDSEPNSRWENLASANHAELQRRAARDAASARELSEQERRNSLYAAAESSWLSISEGFQQIINAYLTAARLKRRQGSHWSIELNGAKFGLSHPERPTTNPVDMPFDVVATAVLSLLTPEHSSDGRWVGRSHSLYFADVMVEGEYAWFETAFMDMSLLQSQDGNGQQPFSMDDLQDPGLHHALTNVVGTCQVAWEFTRIDPGDCDDFIQRWLDWFAAASEGQLRRPNQLPERTVPKNWRH